MHSWPLQWWRPQTWSSSEVEPADPGSFPWASLKLLHRQGSAALGKILFSRSFPSWYKQDSPLEQQFCFPSCTEEKAGDLQETFLSSDNKIRVMVPIQGANQPLPQSKHSEKINKNVVNKQLKLSSNPQFCLCRFPRYSAEKRRKSQRKWQLINLWNKRWFR